MGLRRAKQTAAALAVVPPAAAPSRPPGGYDAATVAEAAEILRHQTLVLGVRARVASAAGTLPPAAVPEIDTSRDVELDARAEALAARERALAAREAELARRLERLSEDERPVPAAPPPPIVAPGPAAQNVETLAALVARHAAEFPDETEEWRWYLQSLRDVADTSGTLPRSVDGLVHDVFGPLLERAARA